MYVVGVEINSIPIKKKLINYKTHRLHFEYT